MKKHKTARSPLARREHPKQDDREDKRCAFAVSHDCAEAVDDEDWCTGCGFYVCSSCDHEFPWGTHDVMDHREGA